VPVETAIKCPVLVVIFDDLRLAVPLPQIAWTDHSRSMWVIFAAKWIGSQRKSLDLIIGRRRRRRKTLEVVAYFRTVPALGQY
jgi:hypothetical protein